jgi:hypothetical protein
MVLGILRVTWLNVPSRYCPYLSYSKESKELGLSLQVGIQEHEFVKAHYSPPVLGGQVNRRRIDWTKISDFQYAYAHMKTFFPYVFHQMNQSGPGIHFAFATSALKDELCTINTSWVESSKDRNQFLKKIVCKHTITFLLDSVQYHRDVPHSKVEKDDCDFSFLEYVG